MRVELQFPGWKSCRFFVISTSSVKLLVRDGKQGHINTKNNPQTDLQSMLTLYLMLSHTHLTVLVPDWSNHSVVNSNNTPQFLIDTVPSPDSAAYRVQECIKRGSLGSWLIFLLLLLLWVVHITWFLSAYSNLRLIYWVYFIVPTVVWVPGWLTYRWPHVGFCFLSWFCHLYWKTNILIVLF